MAVKLDNRAGCRAQGQPKQASSATKSGGAPAQRTKTSRRPRKVSPKSLEAAALHYLERFASSAKNLRRVLTRRVVRSARVHDIDPDEAAHWIDAIVDRFTRSGLLDDTRYAENLAHSLSRRGVATRGIRARLQQKGVASEAIDQALTALAEDTPDPDLTAALALARRRRLGPHRDPARRSEFRDKDLAALARAGFSYEVARRVVDKASAEAFEDTCLE